MDNKHKIVNPTYHFNGFFFTFFVFQKYSDSFLRFFIVRKWVYLHWDHIWIESLTPSKMRWLLESSIGMENGLRWEWYEIHTEKDLLLTFFKCFFFKKWFQEYQQDSSTHNQRKLPSILQKVVASPKHLSCCELQAVPITSSFTDDKQYLERFKALITLELWESLCSSSVQPQWSALGTIHQATLTATMRCIVKLSQSKLEMLQENDVLLLSIKSSVIKETQRIPAVVLKATVVPSSEKNTRAHTLGITNYSGMLLEFDLLVNQSSSFKSITPSTRLTIEVSKMGSFNQSVKQMKAMSSLAEKNASLLQIIMNPTDYSHAFENDIYITTARTGSSLRMNANQYKAVESISSMVTSNSKDARIALLQGPPGNPSYFPQFFR